MLTSYNFYLMHYEFIIYLLEFTNENNLKKVLVYFIKNS